MVRTRITSSSRCGTALGMAAMGLALSFAFMPEAASGEGVTGYYIGNAAHSLTKVGNWKDGIRPGRFLEDGVVVGDYDGTMVFDNNSTGWGVNLYANGLQSVKNMIFRGDQLKQFYVPEYATFWLESGGKFEVEADAATSPSFANGTYLKIRDVTQTGEYIEIINHSTAHPLLLGGVGNSQSVSDQFLPEFRFGGEGDIVFAQNSYTPNGFNASANGSAVVLVFGLTGTFKHEGQHQTYVQSFVVPESDASHRIELNKNGFNILGTDSAMMINADTLVTGEKGLVFGQYQWSPSQIHVAQGKTLTLDVGTLATAYAGGTKGLWFFGPGTSVLTTRVKSSIAEPYYVENGATLKTPIIGAVGATDSPMGTGDRINLANSGRLTYTGSGETTDRRVAIRYASAGYLEQAGTGSLTITGDFSTPNSGTSGLYLVNDTDQEATYSGLLADNGSGKLGICKQGRGLWRIGCAATYTGETKVLGGTLALGPSASIASSDLLLNSGTLRVENGSAAFKSLTLQAGTANGLAVADGVSYTLPAFTRGEDATLDVSVGSGAELTMTGLSDGRTPEWLTVNGRTGFIRGGKVKSVDDVSVAIDAKGGVIPDAAADIVGITTAVGAGTSVSLEKPSTTVTVVNQRQNAVDAEIALKAGETLKTAEVVVSDGAKNLTIAARDGVATLAGPGEEPVCLNPASGTTLALAGDLAVAAAEITGGGTISVGPDVSLTTLTTAGSPTLEMAESSYCELDSWMVRDAKAVFAGAGILSVANLNLGGVGTADSGLTFDGGIVTNRTGLFKTGSGYARLDGGTFVENGTQLTWGASPSQVTFEQTGGVFRHDGQFVLGSWDT